MSGKIAIACGDPSGVGPEVIAAWIAANPAEARDVAVIGPGRWLESLPDGAARIAVGREDYAPKPGEPDPEGSLTAWAALEKAASLCKAGDYAGAVTGPVSKEKLAAIGWNFPGQTEFFAARWGGDPTMAFCGGRLRVALATWHIPLREVPARLTAATLARTVFAAAELARAEGRRLAAHRGLRPQSPRRGGRASSGRRSATSSTRCWTGFARSCPDFLGASRRIPCSPGS